MRASNALALSLPLLLALLSAPSSARLFREECTLPPSTWMLYTSGLSPSSATSAHCERCISSFAVSRLNQTDPSNVFAFHDDSELTCLALYLAGTLGMRTICRDCQKEVAAIKDAVEGAEQCSGPMRSAIARAAAGCNRISLSSFPFGGTLARITCKLLVSEALAIFHVDSPPDSKCVADMNTARKEAEEAVKELPDETTVEAVRSNPVLRDFVDVDGLVAADMDLASELTSCYSEKPYSLADRDPAPFCPCLTRDSTPAAPSEAISAAQRVFQATDLTTFGVHSLIRESLRAVLIDTAKCFDLDDGAFFVRGRPPTIVSPTPTPSPSPPSSLFNAPDPNPSCFPADATVLLEDGRRLPMAKLRVGHRVQTAPGPVFSDLFLFTHRASDVVSAFVLIRTRSGHELRVSPGHYLRVDGALRPAAAVRRGDAVVLASGEMTVVVGVEEVQARGLYNPQTVHGDIVVDGIVSSTYTTAVEPRFAHGMLVAVRWLYASIPSAFLRPLLEAVFAEGSPRLAAVLPGGRGCNLEL